MGTDATLPIRGPGARWMAAAATVAFLTACASGGGGLDAPEAQAVLAVLVGDWVLDEPASSPRPDIRDITSVAGGARSPMESEDLRRAAFDLLLLRPAELSLRVDGANLRYMPSPGDDIEMPTSGKVTSQLVSERNIRARVFWEEGRVGIEYAAGLWRVRETLEPAGRKLRMTRTLRMTGVTMSPVVLMYDQARAG